MIGSIEIINSNNERVGYAGVDLTPENVPLIASALVGASDLESVEPVKQPTGRVPEAQWTGTARDLDVVIMLWPEAPDPIEFTNPEDVPS